MTHARWLIAALPLLPFSAGAQEPQWKAIACTAESPDFARGTVFTFYFSNSGHVRYREVQYPATVTNAEINFCAPTADNHRTCFTISRISGRFSYDQRQLHSRRCQAQVLRASVSPYP